MSIKRYQILLLLCIILSVNLYGQDKRDYITPKGMELYYRLVQDANGWVLPMADIAAVSAGKNGLALTFYLRTNLKNITKPLKLVSFMMEYETNTFMEIYYIDGTISFRRRVNLSSPVLYYDYKLFDPLFDIPAGEATFKISVFFTSSFFWLETGSSSPLVKDKRHSAVFFGLDAPTYTFMDKFLKRDQKAKIKFGDPDSKIIFTMPEEISINEFNLKELKDELQTHFCEDN
ncbi:hypothetical protein [Bacteroides eggerthii]|jgi:hypothetical protein|uniref:hypothetical protein n=1 Tax=Bacteroides eggerthii TaxID=28111 RepID=UPI0022E08C30|nr:hypothetical protein [Bacteroides eggerthii]